MSRIAIGCVLLAITMAVSASPALAVYNQDPDAGVRPGSCAPNDQCCLCKLEAWTTYDKCVKDNCYTFPVNVTGWTRALCVQQCSNVRAQDIVKCTTDGKCA